MRQPINAGKYRYLVTIRDQFPTTRNSFGERVGPGSTVFSGVWAEKQDWSGTEMTESGRETASVLTKWITRYRAGILPDMELVSGSDVYNIQSVLDFDGTKREMVLICQRVVM